jgi:hypothetical protein
VSLNRCNNRLGKRQFQLGERDDGPVGEAVGLAGKLFAFPAVELPNPVEVAFEGCRGDGCRLAGGDGDDGRFGGGDDGADSVGRCASSKECRDGGNSDKRGCDGLLIRG